MNVLMILSMLVIAAYTVAVCVKQGGIPYSISATFYRLEHPYWFMATIWLTAGLLMPVILETSKPESEICAFLSCAGMLLVGAAPNFKYGFERKIHTAGAALCLAGSQTFVALSLPWCLLVWIAYVAYTVVMMLRRKSDSIISDFMRTKPMFWIEIAALASTYLSLLIL